MLLRLFLTVILASVPCRCCSMPDGSSSEFLDAFTPGDREDPPENFTLLISTVESESVQVNIETLTGFSFVGTVTSTESLHVQIPLSFMVNSTTQRNKGILVSAENKKNIVVNGLHYHKSSSDAFLALPCGHLSVVEYEYYGVSYYSGLRLSYILIVGCENNTLLRIGTGEEIVLDRMQTYYWENAIVSGTKLVSNKPLVVYSGNRCASVPEGTGYCDHLTEQVPPTATWGKQFMTASLAGRATSDLYRIITSQSYTLLSINCSTGVSITNKLTSPGSVYEFTTQDDGTCFITADKPIFLAQFALGRTIDGVGDPFMMMIAPVEQYGQNFFFNVFSGFSSYITIYVTSNNFQPNDIYFDEYSLGQKTWTQVYCDTFECGYTTYINLAAGEHRLYQTNTSSNISVSVYGFDRGNSYGYPGGLCLEPINGDTPVGNISILPGEVCTHCGHSVHFTCSVSQGDNVTFSWKDLTNNDILGSRKDLSVTALGGRVFECTGRNSFSSHSNTARLYVYPHLLDGPNDVTVLEGQSVNMTCVFEGETTITWFHNGSKIKESNLTFFTENKTNDSGLSTLTIIKADISDSGSYSCSALTGVCRPVTGHATLIVNRTKRIQLSSSEITTIHSLVDVESTTFSRISFYLTTTTTTTTTKVKKVDYTSSTTTIAESVNFSLTNSPAVTTITNNGFKTLPPSHQEELLLGDKIIAAVAGGVVSGIIIGVLTTVMILLIVKSCVRSARRVREKKMVDTQKNEAYGVVQSVREESEYEVIPACRITTSRV